MTRLRRDPRAERATSAVSSARRPRFALSAASASRRPRRDPRADRDSAETPGAGVRRRFDLSNASGSAILPPLPAAAPTEAKSPDLRVIEAPAFLVFAVADAPAGHLTTHDRQTIGAARALADPEGGAVALLCVHAPSDAGEAGADRLALLSSSNDPEERAAFLVSVIKSLGPRHVLWPESEAGGDLARRTAVRLGEELFCGAEQVSAKIVSRPAQARRIEQRRVPPRLVTLADGAAAPYMRLRHEARPLHVPPPAPFAGGAIISIEEVPGDPATMTLAEADFVVSAGNGVTDFDAFRALARVLGATPGASRMVCDAGLMPRAAQVGASGTVLKARCYFALGIAGAPQHLQGVAQCEHVLAVNTDLHAAMIKRAGLAVIADAQAVMPAVIALLAKERA